jgi:UDP-galactopyranose mutase
MYDLLLVGAGLTSATICSILKHTHKILVIDVRHHIAGNCYDYESGGSLLHKFGPHLFHSSNQDVINLLSNYTDWIPYSHKVTAELQDGSRVPFPYSQETAKVLKKELSEQEVIDTFFKPYSTKMWGVEWDKLSPIIKNRVPKNTNKTSDYFVGQFTGIPKYGYTEMIKKMFSGVDIILGADQDEWQSIDAKKIIYCGRPDLIKLKNGLRAGNMYGDWLTYRNLEFTFKSEAWDADTPVVNFCHNKVPFTRKTFLPVVLGGQSRIVTYETPKPGYVTDISPFYFYPTEENTNKSLKIQQLVKTNFPNLVFAGRLGLSSYIDMHEAVNTGINMSKNLL